MEFKLGLLLSDINNGLFSFVKKAFKFLFSEQTWIGVIDWFVNMLVSSICIWIGFIIVEDILYWTLNFENIIIDFFNGEFQSHNEGFWNATRFIIMATLFFIVVVVQLVILFDFSDGRLHPIDVKKYLTPSKKK